jgi:hypothetical protein
MFWKATQLKPMTSVMDVARNLQKGDHANTLAVKFLKKQSSIQLQ